MDEQDFTLLQVLGRTRNITHAADELYITQSSVCARGRASSSRPPARSC